MEIAMADNPASPTKAGSADTRGNYYGDGLSARAARQNASPARGGGQPIQPAQHLALGEDVWRGLSTVAGSWIGGGANQTAMKEIFEVSDNLFATMIIVDVVVANIWMGFLLYGANISDKIDLRLKADNTAITELKNKIADYRASISEMPTTTSLFLLMAIAFGGVAMAHIGADIISPFLESGFPAGSVMP